MNTSALEVIAELYPIYGEDFLKHVQVFSPAVNDWIPVSFELPFDLYSDVEYRVKPELNMNDADRLVEKFGDDAWMYAQWETKSFSGEWVNCCVHHHFKPGDGYKYRAKPGVL